MHCEIKWSETPVAILNTDMQKQSKTWREIIIHTIFYLQTFVISAPLYPSVISAISSKSQSSDCVTSLRLILRSAKRPFTEKKLLQVILQCICVISIYAAKRLFWRSDAYSSVANLVLFSVLLQNHTCVKKLLSESLGCLCLLLYH